MSVAAVEEDRRRAILDAAVAVVVERGYASARVSDIARRAGTSTGTVHYYFPTKVDVLDAALQHASERSHQRHRAELASITEPREQLLKLIDLQLPDADIADEWAIWLEFWNEARGRDELRERNQEIYTRWVSMIESIVRNGQRLGQFNRDVDPVDFAIRFAGLFDGLGIQVLLQPSLENRWRLRGALRGVVERELLT
jgi:AcrR family transcriptional regulator